MHAAGERRENFLMNLQNQRKSTRSHQADAYNIQTLETEAELRVVVLTT